MSAPKTHEEWAAIQLAEADKRLCDCGRPECMEGAIVQISWSFLNYVNDQVDLRQASPELVGSMIMLARAHQRLSQLNGLDAQVSKEVMH